MRDRPIFDKDKDLNKKEKVKVRKGIKLLIILTVLLAVPAGVLVRQLVLRHFFHSVEIPALSSAPPVLAIKAVSPRPVVAPKSVPQQQRRKMGIAAAPVKKVRVRGAVVHSHGWTGAPLMEGIKNPTQLAELVERSLKSDPTGHKLLDPTQCRKNGSCATPRTYFVGIRGAHPSAMLGDIADLPRYLRSLVPEPAPAGDYHMSRLLVHGMQHRYDAIGWHRRFFKGEVAWCDPNTGEPVLAGKCGNVVGAVMVSGQACRTVDFTGKPGDEWRFAVLAQKRLPASACWQLCDGNICSAPPSPCDHCNWIGPKSVIPAGFRPLYTGRYVAHASHQSLRFPREVEQNYVALCDMRAGLGESDSWVVSPSKWKEKKEKGRVTVVRVPYGGQMFPVWGPDAIDLTKFPDRPQ